MRPHSILTLSICTIFSCSGWTAEVVYKGSDTISSAPFYSGIKEKTDTSALQQRKRQQNGNPYTLRNRLPIRSELLKPGEPRIVEQEHQQPVFVIGGDKLSRDWFTKEAPQLARIRAVGVVIALESESEWSQIQRVARHYGLIVHTVNGDAIAEAYQIDTYPTVVVGEGVLDE